MSLRSRTRQTSTVMSSIQQLPAQTQIGCLLAGARLLATKLSVGQLVHLADRLAALMAPRLLDDAHILELARTTERHAHRACRLVPGANCLHRAVATRVWLACRGVPSRIVIGFRKRPQLEGHAWLEVTLTDGRQLLFCSPADGYKEVLDAALIGQKMRFS